MGWLETIGLLSIGITCVTIVVVTTKFIRRLVDCTELVEHHRLEIRRLDRVYWETRIELARLQGTLRVQEITTGGDGRLLVTTPVKKNGRN